MKYTRGRARETMSAMNTWWGHMLIGVSSGIATSTAGLVAFMYFHHDPYWSPHRFGSLPVELAFIPLCARNGCQPSETGER